MSPPEANVERTSVTSRGDIRRVYCERSFPASWRLIVSFSSLLSVCSRSEYERFFFFNRSKHICGWQIVGYCSIASKVHLREEKRSSYPLDLRNNVRKTRWKFHRESLENFLRKISLVIFFISKKMHREYIFNLSSNIGRDLTLGRLQARLRRSVYSQKNRDKIER